MRRLMMVAVVLTLPLLAGCPGRVVEQVPGPVREVPVPVACVGQVPERPVLVHDELGPDYPLDGLYGAALQDRTALELYASKLEIEVKACATIPK